MKNNELLEIGEQATVGEFKSRLSSFLNESEYITIGRKTAITVRREIYKENNWRN